MIMEFFKLMFVMLSAVVLYTYVGYGIVLWLMVKVKQLRGRSV